MRPATANAISQGKHGPYNAVDYRPVPDRYFYAPEDGEITYYANNGDAGLQIQMQGKTGRHGFAHTDPNHKLVKVGQKVKKGQKIGRMGYTGYTIPAGPGGTHLHQTLRLPSGTYVYPPSKVTEPFGGEEMVTKHGVQVLYRFYYGESPSADELKKYVGKVTFDDLSDKLAKSAEYDAKVKQMAGVKKFVSGVVTSHLPARMRA